MSQVLSYDAINDLKAKMQLNLRLAMGPNSELVQLLDTFIAAQSQGRQAIL